MQYSSAQVNRWIGKLHKRQAQRQYLESLPLLYHCVKYYEVESRGSNKHLIDKLTHFYRQFLQNYDRMSQLDQVHLFMFEEVQNILDKISQPAAIQQQQLKLKNAQNELPFNSANTKQKTGLSIVEPVMKNQAEKEESEEMWGKIQNWYRDHNVDLAYSMVKEMKKKWGNRITGQREQKMKMIEKDYAEMIENYAFFEQKGYEKDKEEDGITLFYKENPETKQVSIFVEGIIEATIQNFLCIASELQLVKEYVPFNYETKQLKLVRRNQKIGTSKLYIPLLTDRQSFYRALAYDRLDTKGSIFLYSKSIHDDLAYQQRVGYIVSQDAQLVQIDYKFFIIQFKPINRWKGFFRLSSSADLKLGFLPMFVLSKSARVFGFQYVQNLIKLCKNIKGSKWEEAMNRKPQLYQYFKERIEAFFD